VDCTVVGIAPAALTFMTGGEIWTPLTIDPGREMRLNHAIFVIGRLRPGVSVQQARAEMDTVARRVGAQYPEVKDWGIALVTFDRVFVADQLRTALLVLLCAVVCVLLIACANIANLLLARAASRQKEIAVRQAMGASRGRLLHQLLAESLLLAAIGGAAGLAGAVWAVRAINHALPPNLLPVPDVGIDVTVLGFALAATAATGLLCGIAPAWHAAHADLNAMLKQTARSSTGGARKLRSGLAAAELALATMLLIGAGLLVQSLLHLQRARLGFEPGGLLTFQLAPPPAKYSTPEKNAAFYQRLVESLQTLPGVRSAAISSGIPLGAGNYTTSPVNTVGPSVLPPDTALPIDWRIVSPGFFRTLGIPLLRGRAFTDADTSPANGSAGDPSVIIVSQETARKFWGDGDPVGRVIRRVADSKPLTVVGVVGDVRSRVLNVEQPTLYYPSATRVWPLMDVVVRTEGAPESVLSAVRQNVRGLDPELPLATVRTMDEWVSSTAAQPRVNAVLLAVFAGTALLIAAIGIYGVLAYSVNQRMREIGLRMALGAPRGRVVRLVIREGMTVGLIGIGAGLVGAVALSQTLASLVFAVPVRDPATFGVVALVLAVVALAACSVPARRASRVDPMVALREE
jgi:putative ABC transport system permease protein